MKKMLRLRNTHKGGRGRGAPSILVELKLGGVSMHWEKRTLLVEGESLWDRKPPRSHVMVLVQYLTGGQGWRYERVPEISS